MSRRSAQTTTGQTRTPDGQLIVGPTRDELHAALDRLPDELDWDDLADALRPVFVRRRPLPPGAERPITFRLGPGLTVALGVDIGPAFMYVAPKVLDAWPVTANQALERALANLRSSVASERYFEIEYAQVGGIPIWWYQSRSGLASALLLLEEELARRFGPEPRLLAAPMRNLLMCAPFDVDREILGWLRDEIALEDPNGLDLPLFALIDGRLTVDRRQADAVETVH